MPCGPHGTKATYRIWRGRCRPFTARPEAVLANHRRAPTSPCNMQRWRPNSLLCWALLLAYLTLPDIVCGKRRSKHHNVAADATREAALSHLDMPTVGGYLEEDEGNDDEDVSTVVPLEAAQQHFNLMPDRPPVEAEAAVGPPLAQLELSKTAAPLGSAGLGHARGKSGLSFCSAQGLAQVGSAAFLACRFAQEGCACFTAASVCGRQRV